MAVLTLLHASDLHFGRPFLPEAARAFRETARALAPDLIVVSGDFTQRAKVREYRAAREYLRELPGVPLVTTPGNHDVPLYRVWERLLAPHRNYRRFIAPELDTLTRVPGATVVALDSTAPHRAIVNGRITASQLRFAAEAFREAPQGDLRVLVAHHHLAPAPDYQTDRALPGARRCLGAFTRMGVELILGGHLHRGYIGNSLDVYPAEGREHGIVIVHSGTTTSRRGRARERMKNSFNLVRAAPDRIEITHFMYFEETGGFAPLSVHAFPRRGRPFFLGDPFGRDLPGEGWRKEDS